VAVVVVFAKVVALFAVAVVSLTWNPCAIRNFMANSVRRAVYVKSKVMAADGSCLSVDTICVTVNVGEHTGHLEEIVSPDLAVQVGLSLNPNSDWAAGFGTSVQVVDVSDDASRLVKCQVAWNRTAQWEGHGHGKEGVDGSPVIDGKTVVGFGAEGSCSAPCW
jgi:hypothetical protein